MACAIWMKLGVSRDLDVINSANFVLTSSGSLFCKGTKLLFPMFIA
jgi:hypothetical protein